MTIDLSYGLEARDLAGAVRKLCAQHDVATDAREEQDGLSRALWRELAEMGVLGLSAPDVAAAEVVAAVGQELGRAVVRGPWPGVMIAVRLLKPDESAPIATGYVLPSVGTPPLMPWAAVAGVFVEIAGATAYRARPQGQIEPVDTLAGEPWGRCDLRREAELPGWPEARVLADIGIAAYLLGAGQRLLDAAATYAGQRTQFGRPIGDFQATAHPLATCHLHLAASDTLVRLATHAFDTGDALAGSRSAVARTAAAAAAMETAYRAHQTFGAMGFTVEGPIGWTSRLIRQTAATAETFADTRAAILAPYGL